MTSSAPGGDAAPSPEARSLRRHVDADIDLAPLRGSTIAILGYGSQGRAHALNLRDGAAAEGGAWRVVVGQREGGKGWERAIADGWTPLPLAEAARQADVVALCLPDGQQAAAWRESIAPNLRAGDAAVFLHGYNIHYGLIEPPADIDVLLVAPKGVGPEVRRLYEAGRGPAGLVGVHQDATGRALQRALAYAKALGCGRSSVFETTFAHETEVDLFGEQTVLCGGLPMLIEAAFNTLVSAGYPPELAYFDCCHEVKLIADLMERVGPEGLADWISDTAAFGGASRGPRLVTEETRAELKRQLDEIRDGRFARECAAEMAAGRPATKADSERRKAGMLARVGGRVRALLRGEPGA